MATAKYHSAVSRIDTCLLALIITCCASWGGAQRQPALTAFHDFGANSGIHVVYQGSDGEINDYYWLDNSPGWRFARVTSQQGTNAAQLIGYSDGTYNHVFGVVPVGFDSHIVEWWGRGVPTNFHNLSEAVAAFPAAGYTVNCEGNETCLQNPTSLAGFWDGSVEHVFYVSTQGYLREFYNNGAWWERDLPAPAGVSAEGGRGLAAMYDGKVEHVFYGGLDSHLHEAYFSNGWWPNDWTNWGSAGPLNQKGYIAASYDAQTSSTGVFAAGNDFNMQEFVNGKKFSFTSSPMVDFGFGLQTISYDYTTSTCPSTQPGCTPGTQRETVYVGYSGEIREVNGTTSTKIVPNGSGSCRGTSYAVSRNTPIAGFWDGGYRHIFFIGNDAAVYELVASPGQGWTLNNLSCFSGTSVPAALCTAAGCQNIPQ